jgi:hypothetical protein
MSSYVPFYVSSLVDNSIDTINMRMISIFNHINNPALLREWVLMDDTEQKQIAILSRILKKILSHEKTPTHLYYRFLALPPKPDAYIKFFDFAVDEIEKTYNEETEENLREACGSDLEEEDEPEEGPEEEGPEEEEEVEGDYSIYYDDTKHALPY